MNRQTAHDMLKEAFMAAGLNGKLATHLLRKSFTQRVYEQSNDICLVQELLGHKNVATTQKYFGVNYADAREAAEGMALASESYRTINSVVFGPCPSSSCSLFRSRMRSQRAGSANVTSQDHQY